MDFLVIDDDKAFRDATCLLIDSEGHYAEAARSGDLGLTELKEGKFDAVLLDLNLGAENGLDILEQILKRQPNLPVIIFTAQGSVKNAVEAMRRGAVDFLEKPFTREQFHLVLARVQRFHQLNQNIERLEREVKDSNAQSPEILPDSTTPRMNEVMDTLMRAAKTPASILILGESGTGKSVLARAIHQQSHLADKPFITVSCPSLSRELLESELFGHVKGAFTDAKTDRAGRFELADESTLFLDEIANLPMSQQAKLLRVIETGEFERVGSSRTLHANVRIVSATNSNLHDEVAGGRFRQDLLFRLNTIEIALPPLRERREDIAPLGAHFLRQHAERYRKKLTGFEPGAHEALMRHEFPGNVRELDHVIERAVLMCHGAQIKANDLGLTTIGDGSPRLEEMSLEEVEAFLIKKALARNDGNARKAAEALGLSRSAFYRRLQHYGL
jgi:NtrC-family two-component system response regulator AlgB